MNVVESNMAQWDDRVLRAVRTAATRSYSSHRGFVDLEDLRQEGYVYVLANPEKIEGWLDRGRDGLNIMHTALYQHMHGYTMQQRYAKDGTKPEDYYSYQMGLLEDVLPDALDSGPDYGASSSDLNAGRGTRSSAETGDRMAVIADVRSALGALTPDERALILLKFGGRADLSNAAIGAMRGVSDQIIARQVRKALKKMARSLGSEPVVGRKAMSNTQAQYVTRSQE